MLTHLPMLRSQPSFEMPGDFGRSLPLLPEPAGTFDYAELDEAVADEMRAAEDAIRTQTRSMADAGIEIGRALNRTKALNHHGKHTAWVTVRLGMAMRTAQRFMSVASMVDETLADGKHAKLAHLPMQVLEAMASPNFPAAERDSLIDALSSDTPPDKSIVRERVEKAKLPRPRKMPSPTDDVGKPEVAEPNPITTEREVERSALAVTPKAPAVPEAPPGRAVPLGPDQIGPAIFQLAECWRAARLDGTARELASRIGADQLIAGILAELSDEATPVTIEEAAGELVPL